MPAPPPPPPPPRPHPPTKTQISLCIRVLSSESLLSTWRNLAALLSKICAMKILMRLCECTHWSESSLGTHVRRYVFWRSGSYNFYPVNIQCFDNVSLASLKCRVLAAPLKQLFAYCIRTDHRKKCESSSSPNVRYIQSGSFKGV